MYNASQDVLKTFTLFVVEKNMSLHKIRETNINLSCNIFRPERFKWDKTIFSLGSYTQHCHTSLWRGS
jgi:hypothetical protein